MKVKDLLTDATKWTQKCYAIDKNGMPVHSYDVFMDMMSHNVGFNQFCLVGAILYCYPSQDANSIFFRISEMLNNGYKYGKFNKLAWEFNDSKDTRFEDVKKLVEQLDI